MPEQLVPETRLERFLSSIVYNTDVPDERRNRLERWLGAILKRNLPPDAPYDRLERWLKEIYENADYAAQFSGLNVEFWSRTEEDIKSIILPVEYVQSGSGDPSPENVRPISGWKGAKIKRYGADETDNLLTVDVNWETETGIVYDGTLDVTTGLLTVDKAGVDLGSLDWSSPIATNVPDVYRMRSRSIRTLIKKPASSRDLADIISSIYRTVTAVNTNSLVEGISCDQAGDIVAYDSNYNTSTSYTEFATAMSGQTLIYKLAASVTYQLTPHDIRTLLGINHISALVYNGTDEHPVSISIKV